MATHKKPDRNKLIKLIHIAKRDLKLDEDTYRQALTGVTGKASCSSMGICDLEKSLEYFKRMGWKPKQQSTKYSPKTRDKIQHDVIDKIRAIWITMYKEGMIKDGSDAALDRWVKRTTASMNDGKGIECVEWLRGARAWLRNKTLESLKQWQSRVSNQWLNQDLRTISLERERTGQSQEQVAKQLLSARCIMWWPLFESMNIPNSEKYCSKREQLNRYSDE